MKNPQSYLKYFDTVSLSSSFITQLHIMKISNYFFMDRLGECLAFGLRETSSAVTGIPTVARVATAETHVLGATSRLV